MILLVLKDNPNTHIYFETYGGKTRVQYSNVNNVNDISISSNLSRDYSSFLIDQNENTSIGIMKRFVDLLLEISLSIKGDIYLGTGCTISSPNKEFLVSTKLKPTSYENIQNIKDFFVSTGHNNKRFIPLNDTKCHQFNILKLLPMNLLPTNFYSSKKSNNLIGLNKIQSYYPDIKYALGELENKTKKSFLASDIRLASVKKYSKDVTTTADTNLKILIEKRVFDFIDTAKKTSQFWRKNGLCGRVEITNTVNTKFIKNNSHNWFEKLIFEGINKVLEVKDKSELYDLNIVVFFNEIIIDSYRAKSEIILKAAKDNSIRNLSEILETTLDDLLISIKQHYSGMGSLNMRNKHLNQFPFISMATSRPVKSR